MWWGVVIVILLYKNNIYTPNVAHLISIDFGTNIDGRWAGQGGFSVWQIFCTQTEIG
jgi:hypothetical protein